MVRAWILPLKVGSPAPWLLGEIVWLFSSWPFVRDFPRFGVVWVTNGMVLKWAADRTQSGQEHQSMSDCIVERVGGVMVIKFNRPERMNSLGGTLLAEFNAALLEGRADDRVRAFVVTGEGRAWNAGADLQAMGTGKPNPNSVRWNAIDPIGEVGRTVMNIRHSDKPTIAAVNGVTVGGGFGLCSAFDIRIASDQARFSTVFIRRALAPDCGLSWFLPRLVGPECAAEMFFTGRMVLAEEAKEIGLVSKVVPHEELMAAAMELA